jgi:hypothetical protein
LVITKSLATILDASESVALGSASVLTHLRRHDIASDIVVQRICKRTGSAVIIIAADGCP